MGGRFEEWQAIRLYAEGPQARLGRHWNCVPAWDVTAIHREPDGEIARPDARRAQQGPAGERPGRDQRKYVYWNRHADPRFHIEYTHATRESPRPQGRTIGDTDREWDALIEHRDRYLRDAGLTLQSEPEAIARCLAETFGAGSYFKDKPLCPTFASDARALEHPI